MLCDPHNKIVNNSFEIEKLVFFAIFKALFSLMKILTFLELSPSLEIAIFKKINNSKQVTYSLMKP